MNNPKSWILTWVIMLVLILSPLGRTPHAQGTGTTGNTALCNALVFDSAAFKASGAYLAYAAAVGPAMPGLFLFFAIGAIAFDYYAKQQGC